MRIHCHCMWVGSWDVAGVPVRSVVLLVHINQPPVSPLDYLTKAGKSKSNDIGTGARMDETYGQK